MPKPNTSRRVLFAILTLALLTLAHAQPVTSTVEVHNANGQPMPPGGFRSGDVAEVHVTLHNTSDRTLTPGSVKVALPNTRNVRVSILHDFITPDGQPTWSDHPQAIALEPLEEPLQPGQTVTIDVTMTVLSGDNDLATYADQVHLRSRDNERFATPFPTALDTPDDPLERLRDHALAIFEFLSAERASCAGLDEGTWSATCAITHLNADAFQVAWDQANTNPNVTHEQPVPLDTWDYNASEGNAIRPYRIGDRAHYVSYSSLSGGQGFIVVAIER